MTSRAIQSASPVARPRLLLCASLLLALSQPARAAVRPRPDAAPEVIHTAQGTTEVGTLSAVPYRIDLPAGWASSPRHGLVVFFHGYAETPYTYRATAPLNEQTQPLFDRGYAVIQSGYSATGWALAEAFPESEILRQYFMRAYAQPVLGKGARGLETIAAGGSMGGALVAATLEQNPQPYAGGLSLCGSVGPTDLAFQRRFAWRAAYDFYFPGVLPPLVPVPVDYQETRTLRQKVEDGLKANPTAATELRNLMDLHSDRELAAAMVYFTFVVGDIQRRAGGNAFDNRNFLYTGTNPTNTASDNALNDGVRRYAADPHARDYLLRHYTPTGNLTHPMLSLHTSYDPRIPGNTLTVYAEQVAIARQSDHLVQQYVHRDGHCTFTAEEVGRSFDELLAWIHDDRRPVPGLLPGGLRTPPPSVRAGNSSGPR